MFDIFKIDQANRKCPEMEYITSEETFKLLDYEQFIKENVWSVTCRTKHRAMVVLGYWKETGGLDKRGNKAIGFIKYLVINIRKEQMLYLQKHEGYQLLVLRTKVDKNGDPIPNIHDQIKGAIKIDGYLVKEKPNTRRTNSLIKYLTKDLSRPRDCGIFIFSARHDPDVMVVGKTKKAIMKLKAEQEKQREAAAAAGESTETDEDAEELLDEVGEFDTPLDEADTEPSDNTTEIQSVSKT